MKPRWTMIGWVLSLAGLTALAAPATPPMPPLNRAPMEFFRNLLTTNEAGRAAFLAGRTPEQRALLEKKLAEYRALSPEERELRLAATDLRHYLLIFLRWPLELRAQSLSQVPERYRPWIVERLKAWDTLAPKLQQVLLQNESALALIVRLTNAPAANRQGLLSELSHERRAEMEEALKAWNATPLAQRQALVTRFNQFFTLTEQEKRQTLATLPAEQRSRQQQLLAAFERLPKLDREKCAAALDQFLTLSPAEREQFLRDAARWQAMSPEERQALRQLVIKFPPLPPGFPGTPPAITAMPTNRVRMN